VTGEWRKLHNEELRDLYSSPSIIRIVKSRRMKWVGHVARMGEKRNVYRILVEKPEGKRPLQRPRHRWVNIGWIMERWDGVMWTGLVLLRIGTGGALLCIRCWTFGFHKMLGFYRVVTQLVDSWVVLSSIELVTYHKDYKLIIAGWTVNEMRKKCRKNGEVRIQKRQQKGRINFAYYLWQDIGQ
jgi:hypothetical protein